MSAKGVAATKPHAKETTKASAGVQICTRDAMRFASRVQMYSLAANAELSEWLRRKPGSRLRADVCQSCVTIRSYLF